MRPHLLSEAEQQAATEGEMRVCPKCSAEAVFHNGEWKCLNPDCIPSYHSLSMTAEELIDGEEELVRLWNAGEIPFLTHFSGGNEQQLIDIFREIKPTDWVMASHRCHYHWRLHHEGQHFFNRNLAGEGVVRTSGITHDAKTELKELVLRGKSMFLYGPRFICSAIVAGTASIAAGAALAIWHRGGQEQVWCFVGDGAEDEGNFYEAVRFVHAMGLPCTFIIEDNDGSCGVTKAQRHSPHEWEWPDCVIRYRYAMTYPHAGTNIRPQLKWKP